MRLCGQLTFALLCMWLLIAAAARTEQQVQQLKAGAAGDTTRALNTYYFDISKPTVALSARGSGRAGRTALTVTLAEASVSRFMPVVSPKPSGMTHAVSNTWSALKGLATMFTHVNAINEKNPSGQRLFPRSALAITAANDNAPVKLDVGSIVEMAESRGHRSDWTETTPSSMLLLPVGQSTGAVADVLDVSYDTKADTVTLEVDLVGNPHTMSEFEAHGKQTLDVDDAHYHFLTGPGVNVDAHALLKSLQDTQFAVEGLHVFIKGGTTCFGVTLTPNTTVAPVGSIINITMTLDGSNCAGNSKTQAGAAAIPIDSVNGAYIYVFSVGAIEWKEHSVCSLINCPKSAADPVRKGRPLYNYDAQTNAGVAWVTLQVTEEGPIAVGASDLSWSPFSGSFPAAVGNIFLNTGGGQCSGLVSKLVLLPQKAYRHVHDAITFTVLALDANDAPVQGAVVSLAVNGDCKPVISSGSGTTDASGEVSFIVRASEPGALSVVAAALNTNGAPVTSAAAHVIFFEEHRYADQREEEYYSGGDAERYAAAAKQAAVQQASGKRASKTY